MRIDIASLTPAGQANYNKIMEGLPVMEKFEEMTKEPMKHNSALLMQILDDNTVTIASEASPARQNAM